MPPETGEALIRLRGRDALYPEIKRLREEEGLIWREIAERLGMSLSTVHSYYAYSREQDQERRDRYTGICEECGGRTNNGGAAAGPPRVCKPCSQPEWTAAGIIAALQAWGDDHGGIPPREIDAHVGHEGNGRLPYCESVARIFGTWNGGLLAAGFGLHQDKRPETSGSPRAVWAASRRDRGDVRRLGQRGPDAAELPRHAGLRPAKGGVMGEVNLHHSACEGL